MAILLENGNLLVPKRAEGDDQADGTPGVIGDAMIEIAPDHAHYPAWMAAWAAAGE